MPFLPSDPNILFSYLNTQLRNRYASFRDLAEDLDADGSEILQKMQEAGFRYDEGTNRFVSR